MKDYNKIRRFYAAVGFFTIIAFIGLLVYILLLKLYPPQNTEAFSPAKIEVAAVVTEYTSSADETDSTPLLNASGTRPQAGSIACPSKYVFGTVVTINGIDYKCDDRMSGKYRLDNYFDIWSPSVKQAFLYGRKIIIVTINL